jgi:hypothetical protein
MSPGVSFRTALAVVGVLAISGADAPKAKGTARAHAVAIPPLNLKVVEFARDFVGKKVGSGECTSLASEALKHADARRYRLGGPEVDYIWGLPVSSFRDALPGDIIQFRDAVFEGKMRLSNRRTRWWRHEYHHHTAIITEVRENGRLVTLLHQNVGPDDATDAEKKVVQEGTLRSDSLKEGGKVWIYRPVARDAPATIPPSALPSAGRGSGHAPRQDLVQPVERAVYCRTADPRVAREEHAGFDAHVDDLDPQSVGPRLQQDLRSSLPARRPIAHRGEKLRVDCEVHRAAPCDRFGSWCHGLAASSADTDRLSM